MNRVKEGCFIGLKRESLGTKLPGDKMVYPYINCGFAYTTHKAFTGYYCIISFEDGTSYKSETMHEASLDKFKKYLDTSKLTSKTLNRLFTND